MLFLGLLSTPAVGANLSDMFAMESTVLCRTEQTLGFDWSNGMYTPTAQFQEIDILFQRTKENEWSCKRAEESPSDTLGGWAKKKLCLNIRYAEEDFDESNAVICEAVAHIETGNLDHISCASDLKYSFVPNGDFHASYMTMVSAVERPLRGNNDEHGSLMVAVGKCRQIQ